MTPLPFASSPLSGNAAFHLGQAQRGRPLREIGGSARGPGWFDSSWELGRGLEVCEGLPAHLGLNEWLTICLAEPQPVVCE